MRARKIKHNLLLTPKIEMMKEQRPLKFNLLKRFGN